VTSIVVRRLILDAPRSGCAYRLSTLAAGIGVRRDANVIEEGDMSQRIAFCTAHMPSKYEDYARARAIKENPANDVTTPGNNALEAAGEFRKFWRPGRTLKVVFLGGDAGVQQQVMATARQWSDFANIAFDFGNHKDAEIRIALDENDGHWSAVGTDALVEEHFAKGAPTMNCGLTTESPPSEYSRVVLHEFGHALGMIHEHQNPEAGIRWNARVVIDDLKRLQGWDEQTIWHNVLKSVNRDDVRFTAFDDKSIMLYPFPREWTLDGRQFGQNSVLSDTDKAFIAVHYPR
jgi:hypothetical protein